MKKVIFCTVCLFFSVASCCKKGPLEVPNLRIIYPSLEMNSVIKQTVINNDESINQFEVILFEKKEIDYEIPISTNSGILKQIINVYEPASNSNSGSLLYSDTITNIVLEYGGRCDLEITEFSYNQNNTLKTSNTIEK